MATSYLPVSDHRFKRSPFFACNDRPDTRYGIYNQRLYPLSSGYDEALHYQHLRTYCCLYDVPETPLRIIGDDQIALLEKLFTRNIRKMKVGRAGYAFACNHNGGLLMDGVLMRPNAEEFIYVQGNGDFLNWAHAHADGFNAQVEDFDSWVVQIQGPTSLQVLEAVSDIDASAFSYYSVAETEINGASYYVSRTGWTGERGFEIYSKGSNFDGSGLWNHLLEKGAGAHLIASDISSMHIRRLEAGILDYGTDMDQDLNPFEIGFGHFVDFEKADFIGRSALASTSRKTQRVMGIRSHSARPVRGDTLVDGSGTRVGHISAGAWSPHLQCGIALIRLNLGIDPTTEVQLVNSEGSHRAEICALPFIDPEKRLPR